MVLTLLLLLAIQTVEKQTLPGATNVTRVDATVACGGATTVEAFPELKKRGFASIINLRRESETGADIPAARAAAEKVGLTYIHIPVDPANPSPQAADAFLDAVTKPVNQPAYIHCASANRVGAMWLIKRVLIDGWDVPRATAEAEAIGLSKPELKQFAIDYVATHRKPADK